MSRPAPPSPPRLTAATWLADPATQAVLALLEASGHGARVVGGAVRNALLGTPVKDVDIATTALPDDVMRLARAAGMGAHPTGIEHGTVTVVHAHHPLEVTTLRRDVETFGRHARVTFTTDWAEDAQRRDFTINALYCARDGTVHDPLGGYLDLVARRVRFIGDPRERIREDYLRILRFFRFFAEYAHDAPDAAGIAACSEMRDGLAQLSGERIRAELLRLLAAPRAVDAVSAMAQARTLDMLGVPLDPSALARLADIEAALGRAPDPVLRLATLLARTPADAGHLKHRLKLSAAEAETLASVAGEKSTDAAFDPALADERQARAALYRLGDAVWTARGLVTWARCGAAPRDTSRRARLALPARWPPPPLPYSGRDVLALGFTPGRTVGEVLAAFERSWIEADFPAEPEALSAALARAVATTAAAQTTTHESRQPAATEAGNAESETAASLPGSKVDGSKPASTR